MEQACWCDDAHSSALYISQYCAMVQPTTALVNAEGYIRRHCAAGVAVFERTRGTGQQETSLCHINLPQPTTCARSKHSASNPALSFTNSATIIATAAAETRWWWEKQVQLQLQHKQCAQPSLTGHHHLACWYPNEGPAGWHYP